MFVVTSVQGHIHESVKIAVQESGVLKIYPEITSCFFLEHRAGSGSVSKHKMMPLSGISHC